MIMLVTLFLVLECDNVSSQRFHFTEKYIDKLIYGISQPLIKTHWILFNKNSPPLSVWNCLMEQENKFSAWVLNFRKAANTFDLLCQGYNQKNLEKSSTNRT